MTGDVVRIDGRIYVHTNDHGTLEKLPALGFWRTLYVEILAAVRPWHVGALRDYCRRYGGRR